MDDRMTKRLLTIRNVAARAGGDASVVDAHFALYALLPVFTTSLRRLPLVVHFQGPWADESLVSGGRRWDAHAKRTLERTVYRRADRVVVLSGAFGRLVAERYGVDPASLVVIPPGVDLEFFSPGDRSAARKTLGLDAGAFVAVTARRLERRMGLDVLVRSWERVREQRPDAILLVAGVGPERERLEALRRDLEEPESVRLVGALSNEDLVALYRAADCSVVPSRALEGFGLVVLESLACGTPAIVTDVGGLPDGVAGLDDSLVIPAEDVEALARRLLDAAAGRIPDREACRKHAERFGWPEVAQRHLDLYREVSGLGRSSRKATGRRNGPDMKMG